MTDSKLFRDMKTMKYIITLACVALGLTFVACESDVQEHLQNGGKDQNAHQPLDDMVIHPMGGSVTISFTSAVDWELSLVYSDNTSEDEMLDTEKCNINKIKSGSAGTTTFTVAVNEYLNADGKVSNEKGEERCLTLRFCDADKELLSELKISQLQPYLKVNGHDVNNTFNLDYSDTNMSISIESNIDWEVSLDDSKNSFTLKVNGDEVNQPTKYDRDQTLSLEPKKGYNYSTETKTATLSISPCSRSLNADEDIVKEVVDTWDYPVVQDYRVMFLVADDPNKDDEPNKNNWLTLPHIDETNHLSPYGTKYLDDAEKSAAQAEFYCIYDMTGDRNAPKMSVDENNNESRTIPNKLVVDVDNAHATLVADGDPKKFDTLEDGKDIYYQKYIAEVIEPNTVLSKNREIPCSLTDNDTTESVLPFTIIQDSFNFTVQYYKGNDWDEVPAELFFGNEAYNTKKFKVENNDGLTWSVSMGKNGFDCKGVELGEKNDGNAEFEIHTSGINYSLTSELKDELTISATLEDPSGVHGDIKFTDMKVDLKQEKFLFAFANDKDAKQTLEVDAEEATVMFNSYGELDVEVVEGLSWLELEDTLVSAENEYTIILTIVDPNEDFTNQKDKNINIDERRATVKIVSKEHADNADNNEDLGLDESDYTKTLEITQEGYKFKVDRTPLNATADGGDFTIKVECSDSFSVSTSSTDWITATKSGDGVSVTVAKNETTDVREGTITITDKYRNTHEIKVIQEAGEEPEEEPEKEPEDDNGGEVIE